MPSSVGPRFPKKKEEATRVRMEKPNGSMARWMSMSLLGEGFNRFRVGHVVADVTAAGYLGMLDRGGNSEAGNGFRVVPTRNKERPMVCGDVVSGGVDTGRRKWLCVSVIRGVSSFLGDP